LFPHWNSYVQSQNSPAPSFTPNFPVNQTHGPYYNDFRYAPSPTDLYGYPIEYDGLQEEEYAYDGDEFYFD
ncbi:hypothetical protein KI387_000587, partial [Taxus chinensis]